MSTKKREGETEFPVEDDLADAVGVAPQAERVARAADLDPDAEDADVESSLSASERTAPATEEGDSSSRLRRLVVLVDRPSDGVGIVPLPARRARPSGPAGRGIP